MEAACPAGAAASFRTDMRETVHPREPCRPGEPCCDVQGMRATVGELGRHLGIAPSTVSHHIKELHEAGLIEMERQGQQIYCCADQEMLDALWRLFSSLISSSG